jgi:hypothetical protein
LSPIGQVNCRETSLVQTGIDSTITTTSAIKQGHISIKQFIRNHSPTIYGSLHADSQLAFERGTSIHFRDFQNWAVLAGNRSATVLNRSVR